MSNGSKESEPTWTLLLAVAAVGLIFWGIWWAFRPQFLEILRYMRLAELWIIGLFTNQEAYCFAWLKQAPIGKALPTVQNARLANACFDTINSMSTEQSLDYYNLTGYSIAAIGSRAGYYLRWPIAITFIGIGLYASLFSPRTKFKTKYTLESFLKIQGKMWPVISPIVNFNPSKASARIPGTAVPDKLPPFSEALSPEEWIAWHRIPVTNGIPDREATRRAFIQQLGPRWNGVAGQPPHIRGLFAAFALKGVQKREDSDDFLGQLALCWTIGHGFQMTPKVKSEVDKLLKDPAIGGEAEKIAAQHAYRTTALLGALRWSRWMGGVLAPAQFIWVRAADRNMWYALNNLGRRSFHSEGAGAMAHFMAEQNAKKPLPIPRVDTAIVTLNQYLAMPGAQPIPPREDDSKSAS